MIVNLNCNCKVQLNELGKQIWLSQLEGLPEELLQAHPDLPEAIKKKIQDDDSLECALWEIMAIFGPYISMDYIPFKTQTIELSKNPDFGNFFTPKDKQEAPTQV